MTKYRSILGLFLYLFIFAACTFKGVRTPSNIFYSDQRYQVSREDFPAIGRVFKNDDTSGDWGSGFLISSCHVLTAYHVLSPLEQGPISENKTYYFETHLREELIKGKVIVAGRPYLVETRQVNSEDWAVLKLESCFDESFAIEVLPLDLEDVLSLDVAVAGFPIDHDEKKVTVSDQCKTGYELNQNDEIIPFDCAIREGNSGGPLLWTAPNGKVYAIGVVVASVGNFPQVVTFYATWLANKAAPIPRDLKANLKHD